MPVASIVRSGGIVATRCAPINRQFSGSGFGEMGAHRFGFKRLTPYRIYTTRSVLIVNCVELSILTRLFVIARKGRPTDGELSLLARRRVLWAELPMILDLINSRE